VQKKLNLPDKEKRIIVAGREVILSPQLPDTSIADSEWLVMNVRGLQSKTEAIDFGRKLKASSELTSAIARLGINAGIDAPTSGFGKAVVDSMREEHGVILRANVHGLDVFPDDPNVRIGVFSATGTVRSAADPFLNEIDAFHEVIDAASARARDILLLMNYALTRTDPVAMIVFAFSAVEMLGQEENWSDSQAQILEHLVRAAEGSTIGSAEERSEVTSAIRRNLHRIGLRQGVLRLLASLDLNHLKKNWDELYAQRSALVHGLAPKPGVDYSELAFKSMSLCGRVLLTAVAREVPRADIHLDTFYPNI